MSFDAPIQLGWSNKTFRAVGIDMNPDGSMDCVFAEEQAGDWTDLVAGDYNSMSTAPIPATNRPLPNEPRNFTAYSLNGTIFFKWDAPESSYQPATRYRLYSSPGSASVVESGTLIWDGSDRSAQVVVNVMSPAYFWVRAYYDNPDVSSNYGPFTPNTYGLRLAPFFPSNGSALGLLNDPDFLSASVSSSWTRLLPNSSTITRGDPGNVGGYARWNVRNDLANQNVLRQCAVTTVAAGKEIQVEVQFRVNSAIGGTSLPGMNINVYRGANVNSIGFLLDIVQITDQVSSLGVWTSWSNRYTWPVSSPAYNFPVVEIDKSSGASSGQLDVDHVQIYALR